MATGLRPPEHTVIPFHQKTDRNYPFCDLRVEPRPSAVTDVWPTIMPPKPADAADQHWKFHQLQLGMSWARSPHGWPLTVDEPFQLFVPELLVTARRSMLAYCSVGLDLRPAILSCCCSSFRQRLLVDYPGDCLLSTGCRTDQHHDWQTRQIDRPTADFRNT